MVSARMLSGMPKLEPKAVQKELDSKKIRPIYWIYGPERMKSRELLKRIERAALQDQPKTDFNYERLEGSDLTLDSVLDTLESFSFGGGIKVVVIHAADETKNLDAFIDYFKSKTQSVTESATESLQSVGVFLAKNFDARRKWSKALTEHAAVIHCDAVADADREPWLDYLAKRRGIVLTDAERVVLRTLDPWSLEIADQELNKLELLQNNPELRKDVLLSGIDSAARDDFIDAYFMKDTKRVLKWSQHFGENLDGILPLLGLLAWNVRQLKIVLMEQESRTRSGEKRNPYLMHNLDRWKQHWTVQSLQSFEEKLFEMDYALKSKPLTGTGLWSSLTLNATTP
jgi:DNA polymerase III delta subunit